jgi:FkbM family methyltransferase
VIPTASRTLERRRSPSFSADLHLGLEEAELIRRALRAAGLRAGTMVDVGAHVGTVTSLFAPKGWIVHAFEPDPANRRRFRERFDGDAQVVLDDRAVGEVDDDVLPFYTSEISTGISGLVPFHESHQLATQVTTVRLDTYLRAAGVPKVDLIKIDTEGFDLFVLRGFPWTDMPRPAAVLCEFEDAKTAKVGYTTVDLAQFLLELGYTVLVSEWHPIVRYGAVHSWRRMYPWRSPPESSLAGAWGNLLAFDSADTAMRALELVPEVVKVRASGKSAARLRIKAWQAWHEWRTPR